jgi:hypothetical protein
VIAWAFHERSDGTGTMIRVSILVGRALHMNVPRTRAGPGWLRPVASLRRARHRRSYAAVGATRGAAAGLRRAAGALRPRRCLAPRAGRAAAAAMPGRPLAP